jgi:hypothetical protein
MNEGAMIQEVENIANPYKNDVNRRKYFQSRFDGTLNKIHLWNLTDYERVLYMDADTIVIHPTEELFQCGHFCATFMNTLAFHTAVMVVKPDNAKFNDLVQSLSTMESFDGADQGFFVSYFSGLKNAPFFEASKGISEEPMNRLYLGYSMNAIYYYEKSSWDNGYRIQQWKNLPIPAYIMTYPIAPLAKPWYWWTYIWLEMNWVWDSYRTQLTESWDQVFVTRIIFVTMIILVSEYFISQHNPERNSSCKNRKLYYPIAIVWFILSLVLSVRLVPGLMIPRLALPLFAILHNALFFYFLRVFLILLGQSNPGRLATSRLINIGCLLYLIAYLFTSHGYPTPLFKIWSILAPLVLGIIHIMMAKYMFVTESVTNNKHIANRV